MTLFYFALAWLAGIALAGVSGLVWWGWLILAGAALAATVVTRSQPSLRLAFGCLLIALLGAARLSIARPSFGPDDLVSYNGREIASIQGVIDDAPVVRGSITTFTIRARKIIVPMEGERAINGLALISTVSTQDFHYGDLVSLEGDLVIPPSGAQFSYRDYLARASIFSQMRFARVDVLDHGEGNPVQEFLYDLRDSAAERIEELMPNPEASLLQGILLGSEEGISPEVRDSFNVVGATHIIAISGANMIVIAAFLQALSGRVMREPFVSLFTMLGIITYTVFVGANPAVVRAAIMAILTLAAARLGRKTYGPASLAFGATLMTALDPFALWDVSFQLSFLATFGLIFYVEPLTALLTKVLARLLSEKAAGGVTGVISDAVVVTLAAQIMTTPIMALYFGRLSVLSLPVNFLIIPAQPPIMVLGGLGVLISYLVWPVGQVLAWVSWLCLSYTVAVVRLFASVPLASVEVSEVSPALIASFYVILLVGTVIAQQPPEKQKAWGEAVRKNITVKALGLGGVSIAALVIIGAISLPDGNLHMTILNAGDGSAVLVQTPSGRHILIDVGGDGRSLSAAVGGRMPFWKREIDLVVLTQSSQTAASGLSELSGRYAMPLVITNGAKGGALFSDMVDNLSATSTGFQVAGPGMQIDLGDGVMLVVLTNDTNPAASGAGEAVSLLISYGEVQWVLAGNLSAMGQSDLLRSGLAAGSEVLYLPSANNPNLTSEAFLDAMQPLVIAVRVHPDSPPDETLTGSIEQVIYRTDEIGSIEFITDGLRLWIQSAP